MIRTPPRLARPALLTALALLAGCAEEPTQTIPSFYRNLGSSTALVDSAMAASMISDYRANKGLGPVTVDPTLDQVAADQARIMAAKDSVNVSLEDARDLDARLARAGYRTAHAVENVSAGYRTLAEAFSGWRESKKHDAKLLDPQATRIGIATAYAPNSKYKVFWSIILAASPAN
jgi:uncharacterized protein YkwD